MPYRTLCIFVHSKHQFLLVSLGDRIQGHVGAAFVEIVVVLVVAVKEDVHIQVRVGDMTCFFFVECAVC